MFFLEVIKCVFRDVYNKGWDIDKRMVPHQFLPLSQHLFLVMCHVCFKQKEQHQSILKNHCIMTLTWNYLPQIQEPSNKRVKPLSRVTSLASLIPPVRATPLKRFGQTLQVKKTKNLINSTQEDNSYLVPFFLYYMYSISLWLILQS